MVLLQLKRLVSALTDHWSRKGLVPEIFLKTLSLGGFQPKRDFSCV